MPVATEFTVEIENRPGALADVAEMMVKAHIKINSLQGFPCGQSVLQLVTDETTNTYRVFREAGIDYSIREVLVIQLENRLGSLAAVARILGDAGINIDSIYATTGGQVILSVDNLNEALTIFKRLGVG